MATSTPTFPPGYLEEDHGGRVYAACTIILVVVTVLFPLRLYARSLTSAKRGWDDHVLIPSYIFLLGLIGSVYAEVHLAGLGRHAAAVEMEDPSMITKYLQLLYVLDWFYVPSNMLSRVSVIFLYLRIFTDRWARAACWSVMAFLVANCLATIVAAQLECTPLAYTWDRTIPGGHCFDQVLWYQVTNFPNIAGDVMIALLPVRTVWGLKASTARKAGIAAVCLLGSIGMIASCVRTSVFYIQADVIKTDPTFADEAFSWTVVECGMYFSAACLIGMRPLLHPLVARLPPWLKGRVFLHPTGHHHGHNNRASASTNNTYGHESSASDRLRLKSYYRSHQRSQYASMKEDGPEDLESGGGMHMHMHMQPPSTTRVGQRWRESVEEGLEEEEEEAAIVGGGQHPGPRMVYGGQQQHGRDPYLQTKDSSRSEIRVETNIEVRRDEGGSYPRRHETAEVYKFPSPVRGS